MLTAPQLARIRHALSARYDALEAGERPVDIIEVALWDWVTTSRLANRTRFIELYLQTVTEAFQKVIGSAFGGTIPVDAVVVDADLQFKPRGTLTYEVDGQPVTISTAGRNDIIGRVKSDSAGKSFSTYHQQRPHEWTYEVGQD